MRDLKIHSSDFPCHVASPRSVSRDGGKACPEILYALTEAGVTCLRCLAIMSAARASTADVFPSRRQER